MGQERKGVVTGRRSLLSWFASLTRQCAAASTSRELRAAFCACQDGMREFPEPSASPIRWRHDRLGQWIGFLVSVAIVGQREGTCMKATCTSHPGGRFGKGPPRQDDKRFAGSHRRNSTPGFLIELGLDLKMRRTGLNQVEREWIVIRYVKTFVHLPSGYLNRAAHERPVYPSPRF